ncbi:MAG: hypothetical protein V4683_13065 [Bacteroidota bacterium]
MILLAISELQAQKFSSKYFYLGEVFDQRLSDKRNIGSVFEFGKSYPVPLNLLGGEIQYLKNKFDTKLVSKVDPYKVNLGLSHLLFTEKPKSDGLVSGNLRFEGHFFTQSSEDSTALFPFKYTVSYIRKIGELQPIHDLLDEKIEDLMKQLEVWFSKNYAKNYNLARHVIVKTSNFIPKVLEEDTLYFFQRRINFSDFSPKASSSGRFAASIFTNLAYEANTKMSNDTVIIDLATKVYQVKGMSWAIPQANNSYALNHEQTHFNITQLIAEKFKERLREEALPPLDFDSRIQYLYIEYYRKINQMQDRYDNETRHGLDKEKQVWWEAYVVEELKKYNINL